MRYRACLPHSPPVPPQSSRSTLRRRQDSQPHPPAPSPRHQGGGAHLLNVTLRARNSIISSTISHSQLRVTLPQYIGEGPGMGLTRAQSLPSNLSPYQPLNRGRKPHSVREAERLQRHLLAKRKNTNERESPPLQCSRSATAKRSAALTQNRKPSRRMSDAVYVNRRFRGD